jgi:hypothetical protein
MLASEEPLQFCLNGGIEVAPDAVGIDGDFGVQIPSGTPNSGSNKGHDVCYLQVPVGRHLRRKVVGFAASHEAVNRRVKTGGNTIVDGGVDQSMV